jgi:hypothetical protein
MVGDRRLRLINSDGCPRFESPRAPRQRWPRIGREYFELEPVSGQFVKGTVDNAPCHLGSSSMPAGSRWF